MNIFVLSSNTKLCARYHCDKHISKMVTESAQLMCTAHHVFGTRRRWMYKPTHVNHPCAVWTRMSNTNYLWLLELAEQLSLEYTRRYGRVHKTNRVIKKLRELVRNKKHAKPKSFAYCGLPEAKQRTVIGSYRKLYTVKSRDMSVVWNHSIQPAWYVPGRKRSKSRKSPPSK